MTCLGFHYTIFDTGGEDAKHFTLTFHSSLLIAFSAGKVWMSFSLSQFPQIILNRFHSVSPLWILPFIPQKKICDCHDFDAVLIAGSQRITADHIFMIMVTDFHEIRRFAVGAVR